MRETGSNPQNSTYSAWGAAWVVLAPLGAWLVVTKSLKVGYTAAVWLAGPDFDTLGKLAPVYWIMAFGWTRFAMALTAALLFRCVLGRKRHFGLTVGVFFVTLFTLAVVRARRGHDPLLQVLEVWCTKSFGEVRVLIAGLWREPMTVACFALVIGTLLRVLPPSARTVFLRAVQIVVVVLCFLVGLDLAYLITTGQPSTATVLVFSSSNLHDLLPLLKAELTPFMTVLLLGGPVGAVWWMRRQSGLAASIVTEPPVPPGLIAAGVGTLGLLLPLLSANDLPYERYDEGSIIAFAKTAISTASFEATKKVNQEFAETGRPRWYSAGLKLTPTDKTLRKNVVIVMMESMRAVSTTIHTPSLETTPFLADLAQKSVVVKDMNAIVPRTAGAWLAVLGGQYPLTNEGTKTWSDADAKISRTRGLPTALRANGYGTAFFTPTHLGLLNEIQVVRSMGFEKIVSMPELMKPGLEMANYMGLADEVMVPPILEWAKSQAKDGRPFLAAIMTNVGHHAFQTPKTWKPMKFNAPDEPLQQAYLNCLRYVDGVLESLMKGFADAGLIDDTIFVFVGDHGSYFGEHGIRQAFNALYSEGVHVPALIYAPTLLDKPGTVDGPRQQIDFLPTIAELLGYRIEGARLPGSSLMEPVDPHRTLYFSGSIESSYLAIRYGPKKFIYDFDRGPTVMFDLDVDPGEAHPQRSDEAEAAKRDMLEWQAAARLSMFARPADTEDPAKQAWLAN